MPDVPNSFVNGRMDSDTSYSYIDNKSYVLLENMRVSGDGEDGALKYMKGSDMVADFSDNGAMTCIGMSRGSENKLYFFLAQANGKSKIVQHDVETKVNKVIIEDFTALRFDLIRWKNGVEIFPYKYLLSFNQIGDLLFFSNEAWEYPRVINLKRNYALGFTVDDIVLAKKPPALAPIFSGQELQNYDNDDNDKFVSFAYRYKYLDGDFSALSFYSGTAFEPKEFSINAQRENKGMLNKYDTISLIVDSGGKNVTDVEVYAREHKSNVTYMIYSVNKKKSSVADNSLISNIVYKFSKNYPVLDEDSVKMLYSNVPKFPKTQDVVGNRIFYANYKEGFDLKDSSGNDIVVDYQVSKVQSTPAMGDRKTAISLFKYKVGVVYLNDFNESTTVLLPTNQDKSEIEILFTDRLLNNQLKVELQSPIPQGFTKMKFVVKSDDLNYETLYITYARKIGNRVYLLLTGDNIERIKEKDTIIRVDTDATVMYEYVVKKVKEYTIEDGLPLKGLYAYFETDLTNDFSLQSNGVAINKSYHQTEIQIDAVDGSTDPRRFDATSGWEGYGMSGVFYSSKYNRGTLFKSDYGVIKEGDVLRFTLNFMYGRDKKGGGSGSTDWYGNVTITEEIYASMDYPNIYEFLVNNLLNAYLVVTQSGNEVRLSTNALFPEMVRIKVPSAYEFKVNVGNREERVVVDVKTDARLQRGVKPMVFRTKNISNLNEFYYETEKTYPIVNGVVVPDGMNGSSPVFNIGFYNGYSWGNGIESYKIKDAFNAKELQYHFRGSLYEKMGTKESTEKTTLPIQDFTIMN